MKIRTLGILAATVTLLWAAAPALAGKPSTLTPGQGLGTAGSTPTGSHAPSAPGKASPTTVTPGQGTGTAQSTPAGSGPASGKIGHGIK